MKNEGRLYSLFIFFFLLKIFIFMQSVGKVPLSLLFQKQKSKVPKLSSPTAYEPPLAWR